MLEEYKEFVENTKEERAQWQREVPDALKPLNERLNGPLLERIAADVGFKDKTFVSRMKFGFDLIGDMEPCCYNEVPVERPKSFVSDLQMSLQELRDNRKELNEMVVSKVKETEFSCDLVQGMQEEVQEGMCAAVELLDEETMKSVSLTRSIPVWE